MSLNRREFLKKFGGTLGSLGLLSTLNVNDVLASPLTFDQVLEVEQSAKPISEQTISFFNPGGLGGDPATAHHMKSFEDWMGTTVEAEALNPNDITTKISVAARSQSAEVDGQVTDPDGISRLIQNNWVSEVGKFADEPDKWSDASKKVAKWPKKNFDGFGAGPSDFPYREGIYFTPHYTQFWMMHINQRVFEKAGLDYTNPPKTPEQFYETCEQLKEVVDTPVLFPFSSAVEGGDIQTSLRHRMGGHLFKDGEPDVMNEGNLEAMKFQANLVKKGYAPKGVVDLTEGSTATQFFQGKAGIMFNQNENMFLPGKALPIDVPSREVDYPAHYPVPEAKDYKNFDKYKTGMVHTAPFSLNVFSKHKKAFALFMGLTSTKVEQAAQLVVEGNLPGRPDAFDMSVVRETVPYVDFFQELVQGGTKELYPNETEIRENMFQQTQLAMLGNKSPEKALEALASATNKIYESNKG